MQACSSIWREQVLRVGFVPTMGNLHQGHLSLVELAQQHCDKVVVSIFVNPTQFNEQSDFDKYPRTMNADLAQLEQAGVDTVFTPTVDEIYPVNQQQTLGPYKTALYDILEGEHRPGHFAGVTTVVNILFSIVQPDIAVFGDKDYQQLMIIKKMVQELELPITIIQGPTCREPDGLAMSSRNQHLSDAERKLAPTIHKVLKNEQIG